MIKIVLSADVTDDVFNFTMAFVVTFNGSVFTCFICDFTHRYNWFSSRQVHIW